jgi:hypothetical protein
MAKNGQFWAWEREMYEKTLINATLKRLIETNGESNEGLYEEQPETEQRAVVDAEVITQDEPKQEPRTIQI